jgi:hypothetical protein
LVSATPAAGDDVLVDPSRTDQTLLAATFSVAFDTAMPGAAIEMQVLDGSRQVCGSATSDLQSLAAGQAATFVVGVTKLSVCASSHRREPDGHARQSRRNAEEAYLIGTFAAHYVARRAAASLTLSGSVVDPARGPLAGARIDVEDGVNLGRNTVTDEAGRYVLSDLGAGTFMVRASKDGYNNSHVRVTTGAGYVTQDFSIARSPAPLPGALTFVGSAPAPGGETALSQVAGSVILRDLRIQLSVRYDAPLPDAKLELELLSDAGQQCAYAFVDQPIAANQPVSVAVDTVWVWEMSACGVFPVSTANLKVTLLTLRGPEQNGRLQRTDYATQTFSVRYTIRRYPAPPDSPPAAPMIESFRWHVELPVGGDPPIPGDPVTMTCVGREAAGAPLTITIRVTWDGLPTQAFTQAFPEGASSSPAGAYYQISQSAPAVPHAQLACIVTNGRGDRVQQVAEIGYPR